MKFTIITHPQRSPEWFASRIGRLTGSCASRILAKGKGASESVVRRDYRIQLACERLTGIPEEAGFVTDAMQRGIDCEPIAFAAYEAATGNMVRATGFLSCDDHMIGCSLDGDIDDFEGLLEIKAPKSATHLGYLRNPQSLVDAYMPQLQHNLMVTGAKWADIMSFDDRLPKALRICRVRVSREQADIPSYEAAALAFLQEVDRELQQLQALVAA